MRVLFFNYEYPPLGGGAGNATSYILKEFGRMDDLKLDLITSSIDNSYVVEKLSNNISIYKIPIGKNSNNLHFQSQKDLIVYAWKALLLSRKLTKENKYDLTHSFFTIPCGAISFYLKLTKKIPYIVSLRGSDVPGYSDRFGFIYFLLKPLIRLIWNNSFAVVSNSNGLRELAQQTDKKQKIKVILNGIDIKDFFPDYSKKNSDKFILTVGATRVTARKGINYLIEAIKILSPSYPNLMLKIMGEGNEKERLIKLSEESGLSDKVKFLGRIPREETFVYYQEADLFVLPSLNEGMSNAMLEALATGLPVITTETGGTEELIEDGLNGFIVKMKDSQDLAEKIKLFLIDKELSLKMGAESRKKAKKMSWKNISDQYYLLYKEVLG